nr:hypothetical protein CFP56_35663 [Quercus suber]
MSISPDMSKLEPFDGYHYKRWSERMLFYLESIHVDYVLFNDRVSDEMHEPARSASIRNFERDNRTCRVSNTSAIKESTIQKVADVSDDDEENIDTGNVKVELDKEKAKPDELAGKSLRQLAKVLKEMHIKRNKNHNTNKSATKEHVGKKRIALQALAENCSMAVEEGLNLGLPAYYVFLFLCK